MFGREFSWSYSCLSWFLVDMIWRLSHMAQTDWNAPLSFVNNFGENAFVVRCSEILRFVIYARPAHCKFKSLLKTSLSFKMEHKTLKLKCVNCSGSEYYTQDGLYFCNECDYQFADLVQMEDDNFKMKAKHIKFKKNDQIKIDALKCKSKLSTGSCAGKKGGGHSLSLWFSTQFSLKPQ